jgi:phenylpropionate dioxygenase-like ring-hydroxylating dioxygenase large terminal subunit
VRTDGSIGSWRLGIAPGVKVQRDPTTYTLHLPLSVTLDQRLSPSADRPEGNHFVLFLAVAPLSAKRCRSFTWNARTYNLDPAADAGLADFQALILDQDRPIAESQRPEELPVDLSQELHIAGPDRASIAYRRRLAEVAAS